MEQTKLLKDADSRLSGFATRVSDQSGRFERAYCFLCGKPAGFISKNSNEHVAPEHIVVTCDDCDRNIVAKYGDLPFEKIPTQFFDAFGYKPEKRDPPCCGSTQLPSSPPAP